MNYKKESGVVIGNVYSKYDTQNIIARTLQEGFLKTFDELFHKTNETNVHEVGCGEGHLSQRLANMGCIVRASDFSSKIVDLASTVNAHLNINYVKRSVFNLNNTDDYAPLVVCCEVLEHLENPNAALEKLKQLNAEWYLFSVPREPIWHVMNICRLKYLKDWGNTPGHLQHWSKRSFIKTIEQHFCPIEIRSPIPWTMILCKRR